MFDGIDSAETPTLSPEARAHGRVRRLESLGNLGLSIAKKLERQAELAAACAEAEFVPDSAAYGERLNDTSRAFAQVSRAVALATALEDRIDRGLPAIPDPEIRNREIREKRDQVRDHMQRAVEPHQPFDMPARRRAAANMRLDRLIEREMEDADRFLARPFEEIIARLERELGLNPDADDRPLSPRAGRGQSEGPAPNHASLSRREREGPRMPDAGDKPAGGPCGRVRVTPAPYRPTAAATPLTEPSPVSAPLIPPRKPPLRGASSGMRTPSFSRREKEASP